VKATAVQSTTAATVVNSTNIIDPNSTTTTVQNSSATNDQNSSATNSKSSAWNPNSIIVAIVQFSSNAHAKVDFANVVDAKHILALVASTIHATAANTGGTTKADRCETKNASTFYTVDK